MVDLTEAEMKHLRETLNFAVGAIIGIARRPAGDARALRDDLEFVAAALARSAKLDHPIALELIAKHYKPRDLGSHPVEDEAGDGSRPSKITGRKRGVER